VDVVWPLVRLADVRGARLDGAGRLVPAEALCWGQIAAAHMALGLAMGTGAIVAYSVGKALSLPSGSNERRALGRAAVLLLVVLVPVNAAILLPRIHGVGEASLSGGYRSLRALGSTVTPSTASAHPIHGRDPLWPLALAQHLPCCSGWECWQRWGSRRGDDAR
jgi:hypothetical protein